MKHNWTVTVESDDGDVEIDAVVESYKNEAGQTRFWVMWVSDDRFETQVEDLVLGHGLEWMERDRDLSESE